MYEAIAGSAVIFLDSDIIILDKRYRNDARSAVNRLVLESLAKGGFERAIVIHGLLEIIGCLSYNASPDAIPHLPVTLAKEYGLIIFPDPKLNLKYSTLRFQDIMSQIETKMSLGDAVMALQIEEVAVEGDVWMTWNAKHFVGRISLPVLTPAEWLAANPASGAAAA